MSIDTQTLTALKTKAKLTCRITTNVFDSEIEDLIKAAADDLETRGVILLNQLTDPLVVRAIMTYVKMSFGEPENPERLKESYLEQRAQLMTTTGYTDFGEV